MRLPKAPNHRRDTNRRRASSNGCSQVNRAAHTPNGAPIATRLFVLLACVFVVMIGFGITLPVLPFFVERLAQTEGASSEAVVLHVTLLTAAYPLRQLVLAPVWGRWSDRAGRRPVLLMGIAGYVIGQIIFGLATTLSLLYAARILGGMLSSAVLPTSAAYVADVTTDTDRRRGMAWLGAATSLGFVVGPALGGILVRRDLHFTARFGHLLIDSFSIPFFAAAALGMLTLVAAMAWLQESMPSQVPASTHTEPARRSLLRAPSPLLGLAASAQFALAMFEATFAFHARATLGYGPTQMGAVFVVCGLVMALFQFGATGVLARYVSEVGQIATGFFLMGASLTVLMVPRRMVFVLALVGLLALGMALIAPNLAARIATVGGGRRVGTALGAQNAANSVGQGAGPLVGGALFVWQMNLPYFVSGVLLLMIALAVGWKARSCNRAAPLAR